MSDMHGFEERFAARVRDYAAPAARPPAPEAVAMAVAAAREQRNGLAYRLRRPTAGRGPRLWLLAAGLLALGLIGGTIAGTFVPRPDEAVVPPVPTANATPLNATPTATRQVASNGDLLIVGGPLCELTAIDPVTGATRTLSPPMEVCPAMELVAARIAADDRARVAVSVGNFCSFRGCNSTKEQQDAGGIWLLDPDTGSRELIGACPDGLCNRWRSVSLPIWMSADGRFVARTDNVEEGNGLLVMPTDGSTPISIPLFSIPESGPAQWISFSPDGSRIAAAVGETVQLVTSDGSAGDPTVIPTPGRAFRVEWAPDGRRLAVLGEYPGEGGYDGACGAGCALWLVNVTDGRVTLIEDELQLVGDFNWAWNAGLAWTADGQTVVYSARSDQAGGDYVVELRSIRIDRSEVRVLFTSPVFSRDGAEISTGYLSSLVPSPDGMQLAFTLTSIEPTDEQTLVVYVMDLATGESRQVHVETQLVVRGELVWMQASRAANP